MAKKRKKKKELTLRQRLLICGIACMIICAQESYLLSAFDKDPVTEVTVAIITVFGGMYVAYVSADTMDHNSLNKYGGNKYDA